MKQKPFTAEQRKRLRANGSHTARTGKGDHVPVVKFFCPWGAATWLITDLDEDGDTMFGLCDLGRGCPELGYVFLSELAALRGPFGLTIERDLHFTGDKPISAYAHEAREKGRIVAKPKSGWAVRPPWV